MALGQQFANKILPDEVTKSAKKHVNGMFTGERNYKIACRFYYHFQLKGLRYERTLTELNKEFDLSELRIAQIIMDQGDSLKALKEANADKKFLASKLPHYNWN
ncbi:MAG: hypothetical protein M3O71_02545 [Bacteroidota bacterium]|nr:hypothetical protein [Bacteroidota bacterium]